MNKLIFVFLGLSMAGSLPAAETWTLQQGVAAVVDNSPLWSAQAAGEQSARTVLRESGRWLNPQLELQVDNNIGLTQGGGGYGLSSLSISQPLAFGRQAPRVAEAGARLQAQRADGRFQRLMLEHKAALAFHQWQLASEQLRLAQQRVAAADRLLSRRDPGLVRVFTPLERMRLGIVLENARQDLGMAEGRYTEARTTFAGLLGVAAETLPEPEALPLPPAVAGREVLMARQADHPVLQASRASQAAVQHQAEALRLARRAQPVLKLSSSQDVYGSGTQSMFAIGLSFELPLWASNQGPAATARAESIRLHADLQIRQRELAAALSRSYTHYGHLLEQYRRHRSHVLEPAQGVLRLTRQAYDSGEVDLLTLIDAYQTYYAAREAGLQLLARAWSELAELRFSAGLPLLEDKS
jgi:cobalt-zinc-cadmium efflux system outer membrane protein